MYQYKIDAMQHLGHVNFQETEFADVALFINLTLDYQATVQNEVTNAQL